MVHAILSDLHGNLEALEAVLADLDRVKPASVVCLGDFVGYGASPNECIERLKPRLEEAVIGNHDLAAIGKLALRGFHEDAAAAARWTGAALTPGNRAWLESLPYDRTWRGARLVHATPRAPAAWRYVLSVRDALVEFGGFEERVCFIGHSHFPCAFDWEEGDAIFLRSDEITIEPGHRYLVTVGSVGQPRDGDPRAAWLLLDLEQRFADFRRVPYSITSTQNEMRQARLPPPLAARLALGE